MKEKNKPKSIKKAMLIISCSIVGIILILILSVYLIINGYLSKVNYDSGIKNLVSEISPEIDGVTGTNSPQKEIDALNKQIEENLRNNSQPLLYDRDVFNVLIIGSDTRVSGGRGRSDTMILISINRKTSKIVTTSFLRDIYLQIPGVDKGNRLNAANAFGGPALLLDTIRQNFKIQVDKYVLVDFYSFIDIVDKVGGVTIDISEAEVKVANRCIKEINKLKGLPQNDGILSGSGKKNVTGKQALGYARIRYVGNGDFGRTDRQRIVLEQIISKINTLNFAQLNDLLNATLPNITTNLDKGELFSLVLSIPAIANYTIESWHIPMEGTFSYLYIRGMSVIGIDFQKNIDELNKKIYK